MIVTPDPVQPFVGGTVSVADPTRFECDWPTRDLAGFREPGGTRIEVAVVVWRVVAKFISDYQPVAAAPGMSLAETLEAYVAEHASEAEGYVLTDGPDTGAIISSVLHRLGVLDDYARMISGEQAMAFADDEQGA